MNEGPLATARWRRVTSFLLLVAGALLVMLSVLSVWLRNQVLDTDRYVSTVAPLAENPDVQAAAAVRVTNALMSAVDVEALAKDALPERAQFLAAPLADAVRSFVLDRTEALLASEEFYELWTRVNRAAHAQIDALLTGDTGAVQVVDGKVQVDLAPVIERVRGALVERGLTAVENVDTSELDTQFTLFEAESVEKAQSGARVLQSAAIVIPLLALASFTAAVCLASDRRRSLMRVGFAIALGAAVLSVAVALARAIYLDALSGVVVSLPAARAVFDTVVHNIVLADRVLILLGLLLASGAFLAGPSPFATRVRSRFTSASGRAGAAAKLAPGPVTTWIADHIAAARTMPIAAAVLVLALWDQPRPRTVLVLAILVVVALGVVEMAARAARPVESETT